MRQVVGAGACDPSGNLSLIGALTLVEDVVTATMAKLHLDGFTVRRNYGAIMVFAKNHLHFIEPIVWQDKITVSCFISTQSAARMNLDVCVKKAGKIALYARTEVCAVDAQTGRIRRMESVGAGRQVKIVPALYDLPWTSMDSEGELIDDVIVRTGNIDYAGHTNNVEYIRLLLNTFTLDEWRGMSVCDLQVAYLHQSFLNDKLSIYCADQSASDTQHERIYTIKKDTQDVLRCRLQYGLITEKNQAN